MTKFSNVFLILELSVVTYNHITNIVIHTTEPFPPSDKWFLAEL
jgi:hypothetical protein